VQFGTSVDPRDTGEQENDGGIFSPLFQKGGNGGWGAFFTTLSWVISWLIKIDSKQIYCSYSRNKKIHNGFLLSSTIICDVNIDAEQKQT